jgi:hypothetical protein
MKLPCFRQLASDFALTGSPVLTSWTVMNNIIDYCVPTILPSLTHDAAISRSNTIQQFIDGGGIFAQHSLWLYINDKYFGPGGNVELASDLLNGIEDMMFPLEKHHVGQYKRERTTEQEISELSLANLPYTQRKYTKQEVFQLALAISPMFYSNVDPAMFGMDVMSAASMADIAKKSLSYTKMMIGMGKKIILNPDQIDASKIDKRIIETLGSNESLNPFLKVYNNATTDLKNGVLQQIGETEDFWQNFIDQQERLFQVLVDVSDQVFGIQSPLSPWKRAGINGYLLLSKMLRLYMLGGWIVSALQLFTNTTTLSRYLPHYPIPDRVDEINLRYGGTVMGETQITEIDVMMHAPNAICGAFNDMNDAISKTIEMFAMKINLTKPQQAEKLSDIVQFCRPAFPIMDIEIKLVGDNPLAIVNETNMALSQCCNSSLDLLRTMSIFDIRKVLQKLTPPTDY